jgi:hypothetical protein
MRGPAGPPGAGDVHRLCVFDLWLNCGHIATVAIDGWYPVTVACCERLGGTILRGHYVPYASHVDYVTLLTENYEIRPTGTPPEPTHLLARRARTDEPDPSGHPGSQYSARRYPARVGATWNLDDPHRDPSGPPR